MCTNDAALLSFFWNVQYYVLFWSHGGWYGTCWNFYFNFNFLAKMFQPLSNTNNNLMFIFLDYGCYAGTYLDSEANLCKFCLKGTYSNEENAESCRPCPIGWTTHGIGYSNCNRQSKLEYPHLLLDNRCKPVKMLFIMHAWLLIVRGQHYAQITSSVGSRLPNW